MAKEKSRRNSKYRIVAIARCRNLEDKISVLEKRLDDGILNNKLRNVNIGKAYFKRFLPYFLASSITLSSFAFMGIVPFHKDSKESFTVYEKSMDEDGKVSRGEDSYVSYANYNSKIEYYSKWEKCNDFYKRSVFSYETGDPIGDLERCLSDEKFRNKILNDASFVKTVVCDDASCLDDAHLKAVMYFFDRDKIVIRKETSWEDLFSSLKEIFLILGLFVLTGVERNFRGISYADEIKKIKEKYPYVDIDFIKDDLNKSKETYKRMIKY